MKKRLALLGLAFIFVLGSLFGGAFGPLLSNSVVRASGTPLHDGEVANYRIEHLPKRSYQVGDDVPVNQPKVSTDVFYTVSRRVSNRDIVVGVSHSNLGAVKMVDGRAALDASGSVALETQLPGFGPARLIRLRTGVLDVECVGGFYEFKLEGTYTYQFYNEDNYKDLEFLYIGGQATGMIITAGENAPRSFHSYTITVYSNNFRIELPENDWDIFPNIIIPSHSSALLSPSHPNYTSPITPLVMPLPKQLLDMKGRDLLDLDTENTDAKTARRDAYAKEIEVLGINPETVTCEEIIGWIYRDMTITFFGNPAGATRRGTASTGFSIANTEERTFIPVTDGGMYYAEYAYFNEYNNIRASYRTDNINVQLPTRPWPDGITQQQLPGQIRLETIPTMSFTPSAGSFRIGTEATLPTATVSIHNDSEIQFDTTSVLTNFTYVAVRYRLRGENDRAWRWLGLDADGNMVRRTDGTLGLPSGIEEDDQRIMRITDFKFTPEDVGDYQFRYYSTTIFGVGSKEKLTHQQIADRIHEFEWRPGERREFLRNQPFDNITIERDDLAPEIRWTVDFDYNPTDNMLPYYGNTWLHKSGVGTTDVPADAMINSDGIRVVVEWGSRLEFEDAPNHRQWLPGSTAASRTKIPMGDSLVLPAILGDDNATPSHHLDYQLFLYRYHDGIRSDDHIMWASGLHGATGPNGADSTKFGGIWENSRSFAIPFTTESFTVGGLLGGFAGFSITGRYDIMIRAYDGDDNISGQYQYTFEVVAPQDWAPTRPRLNGLFRAGQNEYHEGDTIRFSVATFTDDSTDDRDIEVRYFLSLSPTPNQGADIESGDAIEIKDDEDDVTIVGGIVSIILSRDNAIGARVLDELGYLWTAEDQIAGLGIEGEPKHDGSLTFRIYAVARNYHAITRGYQVGDVVDGYNFSIANISRPVTNLHPNARHFLAAVFGSVTIFDLTYGAAAHITDLVSDGEGGTDNSWYDADVLRQDSQIAIPALRFYYPNDTRQNQLYSTITYSVTFDGHTRDARSYNAQNRPVGGGWQGNIGKLTNSSAFENFGGRQIGGLLERQPDDTYEGATFNDPNFINQRYFMPMGVGVHYITVRVTNAGGNISVFVGTITVVGTPQATSRLIGERTVPMRIGETEKMPTVEITIDHRKYVTEHTTGLSGFVVTAEIHPILGEQAKVGEFTILFGSENGSDPAMQFNDFVPRAVDTYWFTYVIEIKDDLEFYPLEFVFDEENGFKPDHPWYGEEVGVDNPQSHYPLVIISALDRGGKIELEEQWKIAVEPLQPSDMFVDLDVRPYEDLAYANPHGRLGSYFDKSFEGTEDEVGFYDPRNINVYNFFTDMLISNTAGKLLEMSDEQLLGGIEPVIPDDVNPGNFVPDQWQYGRIFVPNYDPKLISEVAWLNEDFHNKETGANHWITVMKGTTTLLDTREEHETSENIVYGPGMEEGYAWFRPTGRLIPQYDLTDAPPVGARGVDWAMRNATNKADWDPVATHHNNYLRVDGEYVITYHIEYMGIQVSVSYNIAMGDTRAPRITLEDRTTAKDKFTRTYLVGQSFEFDTFDLVVTGTRNDEIFVWDASKGENNWLARSQRNPNFAITIMTFTGRPVLPGGDHDYTITVRDGEGEDWSEIHRFTFQEAGTYYLTFRVTSVAGVTNSREYKLTVEDRTPSPPIAPTEVWGTILIIISIGLFIGVVIYFIRTGQQTKFASAKNKPNKKRSKEKEEEDADGGVV